MNLRSEELESAEKEDGKKNAKAIGANISPNAVLVIIIAMCLAAIVVLLQIQSPNNLFSGIHSSTDTDLPVFYIALITLFAAALTVWISWLIKEEAMLISKRIIYAHENTIKEQTEVLHWESRYSSLQAWFNTRMKFAELRLNAECVQNKLLDITQFNFIPMSEWANHPTEIDAIFSSIWYVMLTIEAYKGDRTIEDFLRELKVITENDTNLSKELITESIKNNLNESIKLFNGVNVLRNVSNDDKDAINYVAKIFVTAGTILVAQSESFAYFHFGTIWASTTQHQVEPPKPA